MNDSPFDTFWLGHLTKAECSRDEAYSIWQAATLAQKQKDIALIEKHHVSTSDSTGHEWDEWGYDVDLVKAIKEQV
jgi:hypothetical protein